MSRWHSMAAMMTDRLRRHGSERANCPLQDQDQGQQQMDGYAFHGSTRSLRPIGPCRRANAFNLVRAEKSARIRD